MCMCVGWIGECGEVVRDGSEAAYIGEGENALGANGAILGNNPYFCKLRAQGV